MGELTRNSDLVEAGVDEFAVVASEPAAPKKKIKKEEKEE